MDDLQKNFIKSNGFRIMDARISHNYSREYLAEKAKISAKYLYEIEMGHKSCSAYILYCLAKELNVSVEYLMTGGELPADDLDKVCQKMAWNLADSQKTKIQKIIGIICELAHDQ